jgi:two-component system, NtrC family, sensor kinase
MLKEDDRVRAVLAAVERFSTCTSVEELSRVLMRHLTKHLGTQGGSIYLCEESSVRLVCARGPSHAPSEIPLPLNPNSPMAQCMYLMKPLLLDRRNWGESANASGWEGYSHDAALLMPLLNHTHSIAGVVSMHDKTDAPFSRNDVQMAKLLTAVGSETMRSIQSHEAVQENEHRMSTLLRHLPGVAYRCSDIFHWTMEYISEGCTSLTGYSAEALSSENGVCYRDMIHFSERESVEKSIQEALSARRIFELSYRIHTAAQEIKWVWQKGVGDFDEKGRLMAVDGFITDITAQRLSERPLSSIATALGQASEAVLITDLKGSIQYANHAFGEIFGYSEDEILQASRTILSIENDPEGEAHATLLDCEERGLSCKVELRCSSKDGSPLDLLVHLAPLRDSDGQLRQLVYLFSDVSMEHKLKSQLLQAQKMEAIGSLASGIAHEINTPTQFIGDNLRFASESFEELRALLEKVRTLGNGDNSPEAVAALSKQASETDLDFLLEEIPRAYQESLEGNMRVAEIVRAMKSFAHPDDEDFHDADINSAIENAAAVARNEWKYVADISFDFEESLPLVPCQLGALNQAILNLLVNAAHAIAEKRQGSESLDKGRITIHTKQMETCAEIHITDTGMGIPEEIQSKIFDPFFTTKNVGKGTGQGLALTYSVVTEQHGGSIEVESVVGQGTTFTLRLPLAR